MNSLPLPQRNPNGGPVEKPRALSSKTALLTFLALAFAWSWGIGLSARHVQSDALGTVLRMVSGFGPSVAALGVVILFGESGGLRTWLANCLNWRVHSRWFAVAFLVPPALMLCALALHAGLGGAIPASPASGHALLAIANFAIVLLIGGPLGEEFGWRGYALPALKTRVNWRTASLIVGLVWGLWHLPLFSLPGAAQAQMPIPVFMLNILAGSVLFGWLSQRTHGSLLPAIVLHTSLNTWAGILVIVPTASTARPYELVTGLLLLLAAPLLLQADPVDGEPN